MAAEMEPTRDSVNTPSINTALSLIPPEYMWQPVDRLRAIYDKGYRKWPPHINLIFPFVQPECLEEAAQAISQLDLTGLFSNGFRVSLQEPGTFVHKRHNTIYLTPDQKGTGEMCQLVNTLQTAVGRQLDIDYRPHMTIAQSEDSHSAPHCSIVNKVRLLAPLSWDVADLAILIRDHDYSVGLSQNVMKIWGYIDINPIKLRQLASPKNLYDWEEDNASSASQESYHFEPSTASWGSLREKATATVSGIDLDRLIIASYNVLAEFDCPSDSTRHAFLADIILSDRAAADVLVLQEVTDKFLTFLLANEETRSRYPYSTHGPPGQPGSGPLPSLLNIVVLSKFPLQWSFLPFQRKLKGALIVTLPALRSYGSKETSPLPLILAACHLSRGLVGGAVATKHKELQRLLKHLSDQFHEHPWIIAGDFNIPTSSHTINMAQRKGIVSAQSCQFLRGVDSIFSDAGLQDTWLASRVQSGESSTAEWLPESINQLYEGEQGATFDPMSNDLALKSVGSGLSKRPQRYDRILVNDHLKFRPSRFNMFGQPRGKGGDKETVIASDHWGIRCLLELPQVDTGIGHPSQTKPIQISKAAPALGGMEELKSLLSTRQVLPTDTEEDERVQAVKLLERILICQSEGQSEQKGPGLILVPVGSFGLGVWTSSSDVNCLCVGRISSKTFFALAISKLRKAEMSGITIMRRVKASSGTMLIMKINGIIFDLQYCSAVSITERFPDIMRRPSSDSAFTLPPQTLNKLKPARDLYYVRRSIPDMVQYRVAHLLIKAWAKSRGLYGAKFGLLGGIHISVMLVPICKTLAHNGGSVSVTDILMSFFTHYAHFDWKTHVVFDAFFHKNFSYHRSFREPLCLLGWHTPSLNTTLNATSTTIKTMTTELTLAASLLSQADMTWDRFLGPGALSNNANCVLGPGTADFLRNHKSYVRIDMRYWGSSSTKGEQFFGWLESRCIMLLVDLDRKVPVINARIWPQRFAATELLSNADPHTDNHTCFLIGVDWEDEEGKPSEEDIEIAEDALQTALVQFETLIRGDTKYFDTKSCWMTAASVRRNELNDIRPDVNDIGQYAGGQYESENDRDDEEYEDDNDTSLADVYASPVRQGVEAQPPGTTGKLRTAADVLNRLRWDANMDSSDYIVGYEDRFIGAQEKMLDLWKSEQTDEDFIPQHRILYFKRRSDGVVVWERRTRLDDVFGSGASKRNDHEM